MRKGWIALGVAAALASGSCKRPLGQRNGGGDSGILPIADAGPGDAPVLDAAPSDVPIDVSSVDGRRDAPLDLGPSTCPSGAPPVDVCGCGCCGDPANFNCYYPSLGQGLQDVPNPKPPTNCALVGCSLGVRYECCPNPGPDPSGATFCANDDSGEDLPRFIFTKRDSAGMCTTLQIGSSPILPIEGPPGLPGTSGWRRPCDGSRPPVNAIGGLGSVTQTPPRPSGIVGYNVHAVLFFDSGTGIADGVRLDVDDITIAPGCADGLCAPCAASTGADGGTCFLDTTYRYGYQGGRAAWRDTVILSPPALYQHLHQPLTTMPPDMQCMPVLPMCDGPAVDVADVMAAVADPEVQQVLQRSPGAVTVPLYGVDPRPSDGQIFLLTTNLGGAFMVGTPCVPGSGTTCQEIPPGLARFVSVLVALDQQQLADPSCAFFP